MMPDDCPTVCTRSKKKRIDIRRTELCDKCPRLIKKRDFERNVVRLWEEWLPNECDRLKVEDLVNALYMTRQLRGHEDEATLYYGRLIGIYEEEEDRFERLSSD
jgi:hypothetical protein